MKRILITTSLLALIAIPAHAEESLPSFGLCEYYEGHLDVEGKLGSQRHIGETSVFLPVACSEEALLFSDFRFKADNESTREGNIGLGIRFLKNEGILGGYLYADRKLSGITDKTHDQITAGAEWLAEDWEVRGNAYLPLTGERYARRNTQERAFVSGSSIFTQAASSQILTEHPLWGGDIEAGVRIPDSKFWLHAGAFSFNSDDTPSLDGVRMRAKYDLTDNIALTAEGQYDDERGRQGWIGVKYSVPFGGPAEKNTGLKARMTASPVRDIDIVTQATEDRPLAQPVAVTNADTGDVQRVLYVDNTAAAGGIGTKERPFATLVQAQSAMQDYDIVYVNHGDGTSRGMDQGFVIDKQGVQFIGSGSAFVYDGTRLTANSAGNFNGQTLIGASIKPIISNEDTNPFDGLDLETGSGIIVHADKTYVSGFNLSHNNYAGIAANLDGVTTNWDSLSIDNVTTGYNGNQGIIVRLSNGATLDNLDISNVVTHNNANNGMFIVLQDGTINNTSINNFNSYQNTHSGARINSQTIGGGTFGTITATNLQFRDNLEKGLWMIASNGDMNTIDVSNVIAERNGVNSANGVNISASNGGSIGTAVFEDIIANNNYGAGIAVSSTTTATITSITFDGTTTNQNTTHGVSITANVGNVTTDLNNVSSAENGLSGLYLRTQAANSQLTANLESSSITSNEQDGVFIDHDSTGTGFMALDFGGGGNSTGGNRIFSNGTENTATYKDIYIDLNNAVLRAENNWWGADADPTTAGQVRTGGGGNGGTVDATPRLNTDPGP